MVNQTRFSEFSVRDTGSVAIARHFTAAVFVLGEIFIMTDQIFQFHILRCSSSSTAEHQAEL